MAKRKMPIPSRAGGKSGAKKNNDMMKQLQKMQEEMLKNQEELEEKSYEGTYGGGAVTVTVSGAKKLTAVVIDPDVVDEDDIEMLQDLVMTAANEALTQAENDSNSQMEKLTGGMGGMNIPGLG
jgi:DNA-binding YbaB/EbfC family protein